MEQLHSEKERERVEWLRNEKTINEEEENCNLDQLYNVYYEDKDDDELNGHTHIIIFIIITVAVAVIEPPSFRCSWWW